VWWWSLKEAVNDVHWSGICGDGDNDVKQLRPRHWWKDEKTVIEVRSVT
jgi:hypothetical protein